MRIPVDPCAENSRGVGARLVEADPNTAKSRMEEKVGVERRPKQTREERHRERCATLEL